MAIIKNFKSKVNNNEEDSKLSSKIRKHRITVTIRFIAILCIVLVVFSLAYIFVKNRTYSTYTEVSSSERVWSLDTKFTSLAGSIISYSKDGISSTDGKGNQIWNITYEMQNPIVRTSNSYIVIADYNGHVAYIMNGNGAVAEIDTNLPIRDLTIAENGIIAVVVENLDVMQVNLYNTEGTLLVRSESRMQQNGYPMAVALSDNASIMAVSYFYIDTGEMRNSIAFYNFSGVGENSIDNLVSSFDYKNTVFPIIRFLNNNNIVAVGDNRLSFFNGSQKPVSVAEKLLDAEIEGIYNSDEYVGVLFRDTTGENQYIFETYKSNGNLCSKINIDYEIKDIFYNGKDIVIYNDNLCEIYKYDGALKYSGSIGTNIEVLLHSSGNRYITVSNGIIQMIEFR
ncbi:MAG: DUF5711 family protein [Lachnospiraceae bacterium]